MKNKAYFLGGAALLALALLVVLFATSSPEPAPETAVTWTEEELRELRRAADSLGLDFEQLKAGLEESLNNPVTGVEGTMASSNFARDCAEACFRGHQDFAIVSGGCIAPGVEICQAYAWRGPYIGLACTIRCETQ